MAANFRDHVHAFLAEAVVDRAEIDRFLDPDQPKWARFDAELGYLPHPSRVPDGVDDSVSTYRYGALGERLAIAYADRPCRVNTYGDSFTQCHQVSDGETWQEYLAAHLGEPVRNFGVGGYGVLQACRRLRREEAGAASAEHVVLNIYLDDHYRNLDAYRMLRVGRQWWDRYQSLPTSMFHANPWDHVRFDATGALVDRPNPCPTPESLYDLCDPDFLVETFGDDLVVHLLVGRRTGRWDFLADHRETAAALGLDLDVGDDGGGDASARAADAFYDRCAFRASATLVERTRRDLAEQGKRLLVLLSYPGGDVADACAGKARPDEEFVRHLDDLGIEYVDSLAGHIADYQAFALSPQDYRDRFYNGHYTPAGNHLFAFMVKQRFVDWLDPAPPAYADRTSPLSVRGEALA
ncbi:hypothetical protein SAMN05421678_103240 [Actinopolymorpha cephalotaxi]|uniref:GDSL-like Lipase/Acylhydrolase family protein n=1 Tax=Actinopolymorpha cephalotaxi TaxID=504797 RepID=A0A1I2N703_9ACTN|nr:SGNH/GDSL hydrolase family protein [Actinopolymorpha cephalotaxi]NYH85653.1 hypothetical protein [Actinopolymorpha cephalotaxi]SFF99542.1 hypothetical protein SAMN05421678_103240 [Actinopolymorpha cephalotaxi]